jgi:hypothetical protein
VEESRLLLDDGLSGFTAPVLQPLQEVVTISLLLPEGKVRSDDCLGDGLLSTNVRAFVFR